MLGHFPHGQTPQAPRPSEDLEVRHSIPDPSSDNGTIPSIDNLNLSTLTPFAALKLLSGLVGSVVHEEERPLPTPPVSSPNTPSTTRFQSDGVVDEGNIGRTIDLPFGTGRHHSIEIPTHHKTPIGSPEAHPHDLADVQSPPHLSINEVISDYDRQCLAVARVFHCKAPPPITLQAYLQRIHRYCFMSTAVYLAAACYIQRLTHELWSYSLTSSSDVGTAYVQVTPCSVHRLILAALRIAHLLMEDNTWLHERFAGVGGVPSKNLTKLEVALCYLLNFELFCSYDDLLDAAKWMIKGGSATKPGTDR